MAAYYVNVRDVLIEDSSCGVLRCLADTAGVRKAVVGTKTVSFRGDNMTKRGLAELTTGACAR